MHQTLYRKWRPLTFDDVCGQEHVTSILRYQVESGKTSHAYLFCGSRGTGKTTCAKLLARALNCEHPVNGSPCGVCDSCRGILSGAITDVIEMDAASNNGVDNIRDIREDVAYAPSECKKRVFIIDEVHMLSTSAFNALLKTLEEPPEHIVFILATTEMHKIPATILSRCQRYDFRRIDASVIVSRLRKIAQGEDIAIDDDALWLIAKLASGGMRDAIGMLELCAGAGAVEAMEADAESGADIQAGKRAVIDAAAAAKLLGTSPIEETASVVNAVCAHDIGAVLSRVDAIYRDARDISVFWQSLISFYRDILVCKTTADPAPLLDLTEKQMQLPQGISKRMTLETILYHIRILDDVAVSLQRNSAPARVTVEMALVRMCDNTLETTNEALSARLSALEEKLVACSRGAVPISEPLQDKPKEGGESPKATAADSIESAAGMTDACGTVQPEEQPKAEAPRAEAPQAEVPYAEARPVAEQKPRSGKKILRAFGGWQQVMTRLEKHNPGTASFLRECRAYVCDEDGKMHLRMPNAFCVKLLKSKKENMDQLLAALNVVSGDKIYAESDFVFENAAEKKADGYERIDEIIENAGLTEANDPDQPV